MHINTSWSSRSSQVPHPRTTKNSAVCLLTSLYSPCLPLKFLRSMFDHAWPLQCKANYSLKLFICARRSVLDAVAEYVSNTKRREGPKSCRYSLPLWLVFLAVFPACSFFLTNFTKHMPRNQRQRQIRPLINSTVLNVSAMVVHL